MARRLLGLIVTIVTPFVLAGGLLFGVGLWRQSTDGAWCRRAATGGVVAGSQPLASQVVADIRTACTVHRRRP